MFKSYLTGYLSDKLTTLSVQYRGFAIVVNAKTPKC